MANSDIQGIGQYITSRGPEVYTPLVYNASTGKYDTTLTIACSMDADKYDLMKTDKANQLAAKQAEDKTAVLAAIQAEVDEITTSEFKG